jgi:hypothetical protein
LTLTGCASSPSQSEPPQLQASLRQPCPDLAPPTDGGRAAMLRWSVETVRLYRECQSRHARTVEAWPR